MNQIREWEGRCQICFKMTDKYTMSMFDVSFICLNCAEHELQKYQLKQDKDKEKKVIR